MYVCPFRVNRKHNTNKWETQGVINAAS